MRCTPRAMRRAVVIVQNIVRESDAVAVALDVETDAVVSSRVAFISGEFAVGDGEIFGVLEKASRGAGGVKYSAAEPRIHAPSVPAVHVKERE